MSWVTPSFNMARPFCFMDSASLHAYTETNPVIFLSRIIAPRHLIDSEIISNDAITFSCATVHYMPTLFNYEMADVQLT